MSGTDQVLSFAAPKYPIDKVVYRPPPSSASVPQNATAVDPDFTVVSVANPLGYSFIIDLQVSVDGSTWYDTGNEPGYFSNVHMLPFRRFLSYWSTTNTTINIGLSANDAAYTMHYRYVGVSKE